MATTRDPNPSGQLSLKDYFHESSSGHYDESRVVSLAPGHGTKIEMTVFVDSCNQFSGPRSESTEVWTIERDVLIDLIKKNGQRK
ncbi:MULTISPECIES: hypothetical protein [unclassified Duganella]|uniref:hypothetical protein n=1 Tax=unclassified Duganella TaxID=2636909 RepID=UPI0011C1336B|nr:MULTISPECIES: hypothetical protein [unclassified Duganella]